MLIYVLMQLILQLHVFKRWLEGGVEICCVVPHTGCLLCEILSFEHKTITSWAWI